MSQTWTEIGQKMKNWKTKPTAVDSRSRPNGKWHWQERWSSFGWRYDGGSELTRLWEIGKLPEDSSRWSDPPVHFSFYTQHQKRDGLLFWRCFPPIFFCMSRVEAYWKLYSGTNYRTQPGCVVRLGRMRLSDTSRNYKMKA